MPDPSLIPSLGVPGFALWILWMAYKLFMQRMKEKDAEHMQERLEHAKMQKQEREELLHRLDARDQAFEQLQSDIRNTFAENLTENGNIIKQAILHMQKQRRGSR
jgi:flagellar biosynthesis/type III secretory pathway M-ring protein FliF/YscJ